jgi:hypothetical protein
MKEETYPKDGMKIMKKTMPGWMKEEEANRVY